MQAALIAFIVACIWGINPIFEKLGLKGASPYTMITIRFIFTTLCLAIYGVATGKIVHFIETDKRALMWIILSGVGAMVGLLLYLYALKMDDASKIVTIVATFPMFTAFYAYIFLGENLGPTRILGIAFVITGAVLINWKGFIHS